MYSKLVAATATLLGAMQFAGAADLPVKAPAAAYAPAPVFSWTGLYIGGHLGAGWGTVDSQLPLDQIGGAGVLSLANGNVNGFLGGGQLGYNYQMGWVVVGVEGSFSGADIDGTAPCLGGIGTCASKTNWIATATGRIGGLVGNNILAYVKGGGAWKDTDYSLALPVGLLSASTTETRSGWLLGAGAEYAFAPNWSGFIEYNYMDFGRDSIAFPVSTPLLGTASVTSNIDDRLHVIKAGVNYRFGGWR